MFSIMQLSFSNCMCTYSIESIGGFNGHFYIAHNIEYYIKIMAKDVK